MEANINGSEQTTSTQNKAPRIRSISYPSFTISLAVEFTGKIDKVFTDLSYTPRESIAKNLNMSGGSFLMQLSTAVQYGLLELKVGEGYKATQLYKKIKRPLPEENIIAFYGECLLTPPLYKKLINDFKDKQLPEINGLANILDRKYLVKGEAAMNAAKVFMKNLSWLDLIGEGNILKNEFGDTLKEVIEPEKEVNKDKPNQIRSKNTQPAKKTEPVKQNHASIALIVDTNLIVREIPVFLVNNREAKIIIPSDFDENDVKRISKVLAGYLT